MEIGIEMITMVIGLPLWSVIATALAGVIVGMFLLMLAIMLVGNRAKHPKPSPVIATAPEPEQEAELEVKAELVEAPAKKYKPVPPIRQHYWYYVSGIASRFPTLRDALSASGVKVPSDKVLDWKKLSPDTRAKIKRVKVEDEQPLPKQVAVRKVMARGGPKREEEAKKEAESVIKKPIGNGCFVTVKKKVK